MIIGVVQAREARIDVIVRGAGGREREVEAVIDTGFTGSLTLPPSLVAALRLRWRKADRGILADGSECLFDAYEADVLWDGQTIAVLVNETDATPLIGMTLLDGYELKVQVRSSGKVTLKPLPRRKRG
jgi:clan AA aspartic protease